MNDVLRRIEGLWNTLPAPSLDCGRETGSTELMAAVWTQQDAGLTFSFNAAIVSALSSKRQIRLATFSESTYRQWRCVVHYLLHVTLYLQAKRQRCVEGQGAGRVNAALMASEWIRGEGKRAKLTPPSDKRIFKKAGFPPHFIFLHFKSSVKVHLALS